MTVEAREIEIPLFSLGTYTPMDGEPVTFDEALLRQLEKNTNFVIQSKALQPPVGYDHPAWNVKDTDAHGHLVRTRYNNGVLLATLANPSERLTKDAREFRRLAYSPEFHPNFKFTKDGKEIPVGPTVVGLAMLGKTRPAMKNPAHVPVSELGFGESVPPADAYAAREELRRNGLVAQTFDNGVYVFSEVDVDPHKFCDGDGSMTKDEVERMLATALATQATEHERKMADALAAQKTELEAQLKQLSEKQESDMDQKDIEKLIADSLKAKDEEHKRELATALADQEKKFSEQIKSLSSDSARRADVTEFCETIQSEKPKFGKLSRQKLEGILMHPQVIAHADLDGLIRAFAETLPAAVVGGDAAVDRSKKFSEADEHERGNDGGDNGADDGPLARLTAKHIKNAGAGNNHKAIEAALVQFAEQHPAKVKGLDKMKQIAAMLKHVEARDAAAE